jgi:hypothetical protein
MDASYLAKIADNPDLERVATASMLWITGLNPGLPAARVAGGNARGPFVAASFLSGTDALSVMPAPDWEWQRTAGSADIAGGFRRGMTFDDSRSAAGSAISRNGAWLQAVVVYEDLLDPRTRPAPPEALDSPAPTMRVASLVLERMGTGAAAAVVTVTDEGGTPLSGVQVTAVWALTLEPGAAAEESPPLSTCVTVSGGSCNLTFEDEPDEGGKRRLVITSLEDANAPFYAGDRVLPAPLAVD